MKKTYITILAVVTSMLFWGCKENFTDYAGNNRTLTFSATMHADNSESRIALDETSGSLKLSARWQSSDKIALYFTQNNQTVTGGEVAVTNISANGKQCNFSAQIPASIDTNAPFDLYAFCGVNTKIKNGNLLADITPQNAKPLNTVSAPVWSKIKNASVGGGATPLAINFNYLFAMELTHIENKSSTPLTFHYCNLFANDGNDLWYYLPLRRDNNTNDNVYFNPFTEKVETINETINNVQQPTLTTVAPGETATIASCYFPNGKPMPETKLKLFLSTNGNYTSHVSTETKPRREQPLQRGRAYHVYAVWDGESVKMTNDDYIVPEDPTDLPYITLTTAKAIGEQINLTIVADEADRANVWIDLNNNGVKDTGEAVTEFQNHVYHGSKPYTLASQTVKLHGKVNGLLCVCDQLTTLDVSNNMALKNLYCFDNELAALNVSNNTELTTLVCSWNQLSTLDVSKNKALKMLDCSGNPLASLDVSNNTELFRLDCASNQLTALDVSNNTELNTLICYNNQLTSLDVNKNTELWMLDCSSNPLASLDVSNNTALEYLFCKNNQLATLDVSKNKELVDLRCQSNKLTALDISKNTALTTLFCSENQLATLNVSNNKELGRLFCDNNKLTTLDVSRNTKLPFLDCKNNKLTSLNAANGNNINFVCPWSGGDSYAFDATGNPDLKFITIDKGFNPAGLTGTKEWRKDATAQWKEAGSEGGAGSRDDINGEKW